MNKIIKYDVIIIQYINHIVISNLVRKNNTIYNHNRIERHYIHIALQSKIIHINQFKLRITNF